MILFLKPFFSSRPWHGHTLSKIYDCSQDTGEAWICSGINDKSSIIMNKEYNNISLYEFYNKNKELFKINDESFPILLKIIDASSDLSVQVHPDNEYADIRHSTPFCKAYGKFECWYFLEGNKASQVVVGIKGNNRSEVEEVINNKTVMDNLIYENIMSGSFMAINPGTVHALLSGSLVLETQQPSDITYRLYDYDRIPRRELHIEDSLNVIDYNSKVVIKDFSNDSIDSNNYFTFNKLSIDNTCLNTTFNNNTFTIIYVIKGSGTINNEKVLENDCLIVLVDSVINIKGKLQIALITPNVKE